MNDERNMTVLTIDCKTQKIVSTSFNNLFIFQNYSIFSILDIIINNERLAFRFRLMFNLTF